MKTTVNLDDEWLDKAKRITSLTSSSAVVNAALKALVERDAARRLTRMGGTMPDLQSIPRRRSEPE